MGVISRSTIRNAGHLIINKLKHGCICLSIHTQIVYWSKFDNGKQQLVDPCRLLSFRPVQTGCLRALTVNDTTSCQSALNHLRNGKALVYTGPGANYHNARQLLQALKRRYSKRTENAINCYEHKDGGVREQWLMHRQLLQDQSEVINRLLIQVSLRDKRPCDIFDLKRAPSNANEVLTFAFQNDPDVDLVPVNDKQSSDSEQSYILLSLNEFLAMIGAFEWNRKGVYINALNDYIYPHYGVFPPTRQDYLALLEHIKIDTTHQKHVRLLEIGLGTGVLSIILLQQNKVHSVVGTDINPYALECARDNFQRFGIDDKADFLQTDLFPASCTGIRQEMASDKYDVILFNPPWLPGIQATKLDQAVYDTLDQSVLRRFLSQVQYYMKSNGRVYLMMSNLGILLGLFEEQNMYDMFDEGNLNLVEVHKTICKAETKVTGAHKKKRRSSSIESARTNEVISLYHLRLKQADAK